MKENRADIDCQYDAPSVRRWAALLGWQNLRRQPLTHLGIQHICYTSGRLTDVRLQINQLPTDHRRNKSRATHQAVVFSDRYGILTPWQEINLTSDQAQIAAEARRVTDILHHRRFASEKGRRAFRRVHPECFFCWSPAKIGKEDANRGRESSITTLRTRNCLHLGLTYVI